MFGLDVDKIKDEAKQAMKAVVSKLNEIDRRLDNIERKMKENSDLLKEIKNKIPQ